MAQQGSPPRRPSRLPDLGRRGYDRGPRPERARRAERADPAASWDQFSQDADTELPPWAGPAVYPERPARAAATRLRSPDPYQDEYAPPPSEGEPAVRPGRLSGRRAAAARLRRSRRRVVRWGGLAIVACIVAAVATAIALNHPAKPLPYVTTLLKGEFKSVPNACTAVSPSVLNQYLPSGSRTHTQQFSGAAASECTFTVDKVPLFLVLEVQAQAYQPFPAATGNGSASQNALDNFKVARIELATPPKKSPLPPAAISPLTGLGQKAFVALQHEHVAGIRTDVVHVVVLERNVLITIAVQGQESGHGFGPVSDSTLQSAARAAAASALANVRTQPMA